MNNQLQDYAYNVLYFLHSLLKSQQIEFNIKLNIPTQLSALNLSMIAELNQILDQVNTASCIILRGEEVKAFCAGGGDITILYFVKTQPSEQNPPSAFKQFFIDEYKLGYKLAMLKPVLVEWIKQQWKKEQECHQCIFQDKKFIFNTRSIIRIIYRRRRLSVYYLGLIGFKLKDPDLVHTGLADFYVQSSQLLNLICNSLKLKSH